MRTAYHAALNDTRMAVLRLGALTVDAVRSSYRALERRDASLAARVVAGYDEIDSMRRNIEAACIELLWKQQPVAGELRAVAGMLQIATDIDRANYYAVDIAKVAITLDDLPSRPASLELGQLAEASLGMLDDAVRAYAKRRPRWQTRYWRGRTRSTCSTDQAYKLGTSDGRGHHRHPCRNEAAIYVGES